MRAEKSFFKLKEYEKLKYVRGSAAFAGFAAGSFSVSELEDFSQKMTDIMGEDWTRWGTEQLTSNFLVANSPSSKMLPFPKYTGYYPLHNISYDNSHFMHFAGHNRWKNGLYIRHAKRIVRTMSNI